MDRTERVRRNSTLRQARYRLMKPKVMLLLRVLSDDVEPQFSHKPVSYKRFASKLVDSSRSSVYYNLLCSIVEYLESLKKENDSSIPLEILARDYFCSIYESYQRYGKPLKKITPYLRQLAPTARNCIVFEEWISSWEDQHDEEYWGVSFDGDKESLKKKIKAIIKRQSPQRFRERQKAKRCQVEIVDI